jgi:ketosteroid isomerase-like protein
MSGNDALSVADRLFRAIEAGDIDTVHELYAPEVEIRINVWHGRANEVQTREQNVAVLRWVVTNLRDLRYDEIRRSATDRGFVQQHVLRAVGPAGRPLEVPVCIVCTCVDGHITRLDEYMDSAHIADLIRRPTADS